MANIELNNRSEHATLAIFNRETGYAVGLENLTPKCRVAEVLSVKPVQLHDAIPPPARFAADSKGARLRSRDSARVAHRLVCAIKEAEIGLRLRVAMMPGWSHYEPVSRVDLDRIEYGPLGVAGLPRNQPTRHNRPSTVIFADLKDHMLRLGGGPRTPASEVEQTKLLECLGGCA